ncbi:MAG: hypothetical protein ACI38R_11005 [Rhodococcus sp. (in: high G+C Gram-positive bacteria)]
METLRYMARALREGFRRWFGSPLWSAITGIATILGLTIGVAEFRSLDHVWQWATAAALVALFMMGSGAYSLADEQAKEATALIAERDSLKHQIATISQAPQTPPPPPRSVVLQNVTMEDIGGDGIHSEGSGHISAKEIRMKNIGRHGIFNGK